MNDCIPKYFSTKTYALVELKKSIYNNSKGFLVLTIYSG